MKKPLLFLALAMLAAGCAGEIEFAEPSVQAETATLCR
jgi:hypothetical protein